VGVDRPRRGAAVRGWRLILRRWLRLLGLHEEPVSVALPLDAARTVLAAEAEVLPWRGGLRVSRSRPRVIDPPEALLEPSDGGLAGVVHVSWWVRLYAYADTLLRHRSAKRDLREWLCHIHR
jgi:hypothetical protein